MKTAAPAIMNSHLEVVIQRESHAESQPDDAEFSQWVLACSPDPRFQEVTLRIVDETESEALNLAYRGKAAPTNVLSFPAADDSLPEALDINLGDIVICAGVVNAEAARFGISSNDRWMHIVVHGVLHLMGYDHVIESDRQVMEEREKAILSGFGRSDPYVLPEALLPEPDPSVSDIPDPSNAA